MKLIFATNNEHKVDEIRSVLGKDSFIEIIPLKEAGIEIDIPEPYDSLEENAAHKARTIYDLIRMHPSLDGCFSEDTGLEVEALGGAPGVKSARFAGEQRSFDKNIEKLLRLLGSDKDRRAQFRTVMSLIIGDEQKLFEGECQGDITFFPRGLGGFGYDSIFVPKGSGHTFAEMDIGEKNRFSHRKKATDKLVAYLKQQAKPKI